MATYTYLCGVSGSGKQWSFSLGDQEGSNEDATTHTRRQGKCQLHCMRVINHHSLDACIAPTWVEIFGVVSGRILKSCSYELATGVGVRSREGHSSWRTRCSLREGESATVVG